MAVGVVMSILSHARNARQQMSHYHNGEICVTSARQQLAAGPACLGLGDFFEIVDKFVG